MPIEETGCGTQFVHQVDKKGNENISNRSGIRFPYSVMFRNRPVDAFYRFNYLHIKESSLNNE